MAERYLVKKLFYLLIVFLLAACAVQKQSLINDQERKAKTTPINVASLEPKLTTKTVAPKPDPISVTHTPTQIPTDNGSEINRISLIPHSATVWHVPVVLGPSEVTSSLLGPDSHPFSWIGSSRIKVEDQYELDLSTHALEVLPTTTPGGFPTEQDNALDGTLSPKKAYLLECDRVKNEVRLIRTADNFLIGSTSLACFGADWAPDESAVAFLSDEQEYGISFVWSVKDKAPLRLGDNLSGFSAVRWSPDAKKILAQSSGLDPQNAVQTNHVFIFTAQGKFISQFRAEDGRLLEGWLRWHTNDIIEVLFRDGANGHFLMYYEWSHGILMGSWYASNLYPFESQELQLSPSKRWQVLDEYDYFRDNSKPVYTYGLYDFQEKKRYILSAGPDRHIQFLGWSKDSRLFSLVNRPANPSALTSEEMPFGWLELNPETMTYTPIFIQALFVKYNPSKNLAWVIFPAKQPDGTNGMDGAIYNIAKKTLSNRHFIAKSIFYDNPAHGDLTPVEWSHDGEKLVFLDQEGNLILLTTSGQKSILGKNLFPKDMLNFSDNLFRFTWSPDDRWLIVQGDMTFWILDLHK